MRFKQLITVVIVAAGVCKTFGAIHKTYRSG